MSDQALAVQNIQSQTTDEFFYFFLRLRKDRVRKVVRRLKTQFPEESAEQLARRSIAAKTWLSSMGGALIHLPALLPGIGQAWSMLGFAGGATALSRMHLYLILEIALFFGQDIDDPARVPEMITAVAATGIGTAVPFAMRLLDLNPIFAVSTAAIGSAAVTQLIGESAIRLYSTGADLSLCPADGL